MVVGVMTLDARLPGIKSLKAKRMILRSLRDNVRNRFNVSISEVEYQDLWQRTRFGIAGVSGDRVFIEKEFTKIVRLFENREGVEVIDSMIEFI
ncbi:MAG TPA: DUF503 domain-containing protein [bacterium]|nr:DUF503 domain-containing protein [bacterium]